MCVLVSCEREMEGVGDMEEGDKKEELEMPEVEEEEVKEEASVEAEMEMEDKGVEKQVVEVLKEAELSEHCSSSRMLLSSTSP